MDDIARLREHLTRRDTRVSTHWDGCIDTHPICALTWALDEIEHLRTELAAMRRQTLKNMIRHAENAGMYPKL